MPLIDLKTNLTTIKFGRDRLNSGDSGQPYIKTPIIGNYYSNQRPLQDLIDYSIANRNSLDFPIRGGSLDYEIGNQTLTISSKIDRERIAKFLKDEPRATTFINKQIGLQLSNPKIESGNTFTSAFDSFTSPSNFSNFISAVPGVIENTRLYNRGRNTLTQVGLSGTGFHLPRHGLFPFDTISKYYKDIVGAQNRMSAEDVARENRLLILQQLKLRSTNDISSKSSVLGAIDKINQLGISLNRNIIQAYLGGPGSVYGIGNTTIRRFDDTSRAVKKSKRGMSYDQIFSQGINSGSALDRENRVAVGDGGESSAYVYPIQYGIQDFKTGDKDKSREDWFNMSNGYRPGEQVSSPDGVAQANLKEINNEDPWATDKEVSDIIKFGFECINNDNPQSGIFLQFRAYLTNGLTDNHQATLNPFKYLGRGEDFFIYQGFSRTISFSFRLAVENPKDLVPLYKKLNALASQVYPDYSDAKIMRTSLTRVTVGDYIYRMPGFLENVNITINQDSSWETEEGYQVPHYLDVAVTFRPIHDSIPERVTGANDPRRILYNNENDGAPTNLNNEFYLQSIRTETEKENRKSARKKKRAANKAKRQNRAQRAN